MSFPVTIVGASSGEAPSTFGPFLHGTDVYTVLVIVSGVQRHLAMYKSTDNAATWNEVNTAGRPRLVDNAYPLYSACQSSLNPALLFAFFIDQATGEYAIQRFDASTDTWGAMSVSPAPVDDPPPTGSNGLCCVFRPDDNTVICAGVGDLTIATNSQIPAFNVYSVAGNSWGSWTAVGSQEYSDPGVSWIMIPWALVYGSGGAVHLFSQQVTNTPTEISKLWQQRISLTNTLGALTEITAGQSPAATQKLRDNSLIGVPISFSAASFGGKISIAITGATATTKYTSINIYQGVSADPIVFGVAQVLASGNLAASPDPTPVMLPGTFGLVCAWMSWDSVNANMSFLYALNGGSGFAANVTIGTSASSNNFQFSRLTGNVVAAGTQFIILFGTPIPAVLHLSHPG